MIEITTVKRPTEEADGKNIVAESKRRLQEVLRPHTDGSSPVPEHDLAKIPNMSFHYACPPLGGWSSDENEKVLQIREMWESVGELDYEMQFIWYKNDKR